MTPEFKGRLEKILAEGKPEEFGELKLNEWENFDY